VSGISITLLESFDANSLLIKSFLGSNRTNLSPPPFSISSLLCSRYSVDDYYHYYSLLNCVISAANNLSLSCFHVRIPSPLWCVDGQSSVGNWFKRKMKRGVNFTFTLVKDLATKRKPDSFLHSSGRTTIPKKESGNLSLKICVLFGLMESVKDI
jgi:hypothetical protein